MHDPDPIPPSHDPLAYTGLIFVLVLVLLGLARACSP